MIFENIKANPDPFHAALEERTSLHISLVGTLSYIAENLLFHFSITVGAFQSEL